jgi:hypothetical protein
MSNAAINSAYRVKAGSSTNKTVLIALANRANDEGKCWPSVTKLMAETELSERAIRSALADLERRRLISREAQYLDGTKYRRSNLVTLHLDMVHEVQDMVQDVQDDGAADAPYGAGDAPYMVQEVQGDGASAAPRIEPSKNRKVEPKKNQTRAERRRLLSPELQYHVEFDEQFLPIYPNRIDELNARRAYVKARKRGICCDDIMAGLKRYVAAHPVDYPYWKGPAAWLNGERWKDQPAAPPHPQSGAKPNSTVQAANRIYERAYGSPATAKAA